jgi:hypothetical protein
MSRIAIHQPNYLPWPGYFLKMMMCDTFVFLDDVQFSKGSFTNRVQFTSNIDQPVYLTIPIAKDANKYHIADIRLKENNWKNDHRQRLRSWLKDYPFFHELDFIWEQYDREDFSFLSPFNMNLIELIKRKLEIRCSTVRSSEMTSTLAGTQRIADLTKKCEGQIYIAGAGFFKYFQPKDWPDEIKCLSYDFGKSIKDSELSAHSIVESIAHRGLEQTAITMRQIVKALIN